MKILCAFLTTGVFGALLLSCGAKSDRTILLENTTSKDLINQPIILKRTDLPIKDRGYLQVFDQNGQQTPIQFDDFDGDRIWDEAAFLVSIDANQNAQFKYKIVAQDELISFPIKTNIHLGVSEERDDHFISMKNHTMPSDHKPQSKPYLYQFEGPGWENDKIAFRTYFDARNGKDIFGKTVSDTVLFKVGINENYHQLQDWGMDILKVGSSLGAGGLALAVKDSLIRLSNVKVQSVKILTEGPVRSIVSLKYQNWKVADEEITIDETIQIWAGQHHYDSEVSIKNLDNGQVSVGLVNLNDLDLKKIDHESLAIHYTHGLQSENKDILGMAMIAPLHHYAGTGAIQQRESGVSQTYYIKFEEEYSIVNYSFLAGWALTDKGFTEEEYFRKRLSAITTYYLNPLNMTIEK